MQTLVQRILMWAALWMGPCRGAHQGPSPRARSTPSLQGSRPHPANTGAQALGPPRLLCLPAVQPLPASSNGQLIPPTWNSRGHSSPRWPTPTGEKRPKLRPCCRRPRPQVCFSPGSGGLVKVGVTVRGVDGGTRGAVPPPLPKSCRGNWKPIHAHRHSSTTTC